MTVKLSLIAAAVALAIASSAQSAVLISDNFDGSSTVDPGVGSTIAGFSLEGANVGSWNAQGWSGNYQAYRTSGNPSPFAGVYLTNLAPHTTVSASFVLGFLESWDSYDGSCCSPDNLEVWIDGTKVANMTANNALGTIEDFDGGTIIAHYQQTNADTYYSDTLVDMSTAPFLTFAHTSSTLNLEFRVSGVGWQAGGDEGFGIDSLVVTYDGVRPTPGVPEPGTWALMIGGLGLMGAALRRRRLASAA
jgi:hypothetical protein